MGDYTPKVAKAAGGVLDAEEQLLAGVRAMSAGSTGQIVGGAAGAVAGGAAGVVAADQITGEARAESKEAEAAAGLPELPPQVALGLTTERLLIFSRSALSGKAKDLVAAIPRDRIASITGEDSGSKLKPDPLLVSLTDGTAVTFEVVKNDGFQRLVDAFSA